MPSPAAVRPAIVPRPLTELAARLGLSYGQSGTVSGVTLDSRSVRPGDLYVALRGSRVHGARFSEQAMSAGAAAVLTDPIGEHLIGRADAPVFVVENPRDVLGGLAAWVYGDAAAELQLLGVTGTSGKTTMTYMLERGLAAAGHHTGLIGSVQTRIGDAEMPSAHTTPEATDLHAIFAVMRDRDVSAVAMEVSSHALAYGRADGAVYDVAVFTNLSPEHLDFHRDLEDYFTTKATLFTPAHARVGVVNLDDDYGRRLLKEAKIPVTSYSATGAAEADWRAENVRYGADGSVFRVVGPGGIEADASVQLPGPYNVANALAALVALVEAGVGLHTAVLGVSSLDRVPGRMERIDAGQDFLAVVDYSHKPGAVEAALQALRTLTENRVLVVLGCGGDRDRGKRPLMGAAAARLADLAVFTNDNPRSEDPLAILVEMQSGATEVPPGERADIAVEPDRAAAITLAVSRAEPGDVVVVAGKGHEKGQEVGGIVHPFDDRTVLREALAVRCRGSSEPAPASKADGSGDLE